MKALSNKIEPSSPSGPVTGTSRLVANGREGQQERRADLAHVLADLRRRFPADFVWGVATSAFQIEGAVAEDGRGPSIWDTFCRVPGAIVDGSNSDISCDHYHRLDEDLDLIASLGVDAYRFSISWPRVQPLGSGAWNTPGIDFYRRLVDGLRRRGIAAYATLYHWDLPQALQDAGGWASRDTAQRFCDYADHVARAVDGITSIATFNEPWVVSILGHESGIFAPGIRNRATAMQVSHHLLLGHGLALQAMRSAGYSGSLGIVLNQSPVYPATDSQADRDRAVLEDGLSIRWYMDPLLRAAYPEDAVEHLGADAPQVKAGDMQIIAQPIDFLGINYYTRSLASASGRAHVFGPEVELTDMGWEVHPRGLTDLLLRLNRDYDLPPLYITENGAAFRDRLDNGEVHDVQRVRYLLSHFAAVADAIDQGVDLRGYFVWSLFDNFEWASGLSKRFGIVHVDYDSLKRTLKDSARVLRDFLGTAAVAGSRPSSTRSAP